MDPSHSLPFQRQRSNVPKERQLQPPFPVETAGRQRACCSYIARSDCERTILSRVRLVARLWVVPSGVHHLLLLLLLLKVLRRRHALRPHALHTHDIPGRSAGVVGLSPKTPPSQNPVPMK